MSNESKTHFKKAFKSPYLSSADIDGFTPLTVSHVLLEPDKTKRTKDSFNTLYFKEQEIRKGEKLKPMILNVTNSRVMKLLFDTPYIDDWKDMRVTVYVDNNVKNRGQVVDGLRISPEHPQEKRELLPNTAAWNNAKAAYGRDGNLDAVKKRMTVSAENEGRLINEVG